MQVKIVSVSDKNEWNNIVTRARYYDFYHCNYYNQLDRLGTPFLFVAEHNDAFIALPLIKRIIEGTDYFDCTSVWGYPGPIANKLPEDLDNDLINYFQTELKKYLFESNIVSAFSRLHPIIQQVEFFKGLGSITYLNKTVAINTTLPLEIQRRQFRKTNKSEINQLRNRGHTVKIADTEEEINEFVNIYTETMARVNAGSFYFDCFDTKYFHDLLNADDFKARLLIAYKDGIITAGGVFITTKNFMQYHVAGTKQEYMKATPMKLIIDEARLLATQLNVEYFHLGGGVGGSDTDSLFWFKSGFSDLTFTYKTWQLIVNEEVYKTLVSEKQKQKTLNENYFPVYRS
jgi:lipid II:glycine glycyltransferase (peptidoglycan interpeptide bridge formation enzyme)